MSGFFFSLWLECERPDQVEPLANHFEGLTFQLFSGREVEWSTYTPNHRTKNPQFQNIHFMNQAAGINFVLVASPQFRKLTDAPQDRIDMTEAGIRLFKRLQSAPDFFYARVDINTCNIQSSDIDDFMERDADGVKLFPYIYSCVFSEEFAAGFAPLEETSYSTFRPGYIWAGYRGETLVPLRSGGTPKLAQLYRELFPGMEW